MLRIAQFLIHVIGLATIAMAFYIAFHSNSQLSHGEIFHSSSFILVSFTLLGVLLTSYRITTLIETSRRLIFESPGKLETQLQEQNALLEPMSEVYYGKGAHALGEFVASKSLPPVWNTVIRQLEAKVDPKDIKLLLQYDVKNFEDGINQKISILRSMSNLSPSVGVLGTVLGLIKLLSELEDFSSIGPNMSLALVTTLYGLFFGAIVFSPLSSRMEQIKNLNLKFYHQAMFWVHLIENRKPAFYSDPKYFISRAG